MVLKLYYDLMSQPSRTLYILLNTAKCNFELKPVDLRKGEHFSEEFTALNRLQRVPLIEHDGFVLSESVAIVKYLARENIIPGSLYPKDIKPQARVEEFLEWQHIGLRLHCAMYFRATYLDPIFTGKQPDAKSIRGYEQRMVSALNVFEAKWLNNGTKFIAGNTITVADLFAACELEQPRMAGYDPADHFNGISVWWKNVRNHFNPIYDEAHVTVNKIVNKNKKAKL